MQFKRSINSPSAEAKALSLLEPLPLVKHIGDCASRICNDHTFGTILRHEEISIFIPKPAKIFDILAMVSSNGKSLPAINVVLSEAKLGISKACASASMLSTSSITNSGPVCMTFLTVQRSIERKIPWRSLSEMSAGNST